MTGGPPPTVVVDARALQDGADFDELLAAGRAALPWVRWVGLIDPARAPLPRGSFDRVVPNAYAAGSPACFVRLRPGGDDPLFAARLLLRVPSVAVDPVLPAGRLEREIAAYWLRRSVVTTPERLWAEVAGRLGRPLERSVAVFGQGGALARAMGAPCFGADMVPLLSSRFGRSLFILGNSAADGGLIRLLRRFGGDVVLTTACLLGAYGDGRATALAEAELGRTVPAGELAQWREWIARPSALLLGEVAAAARTLLVPSAWLAAEVAARYGREATVLPMAADAAPGQGLAAQAAGLQAEACVWAMELLWSWGRRVRLSLACPAAERPALAALAARLGIGAAIGFGDGMGEVTAVLAMRGGAPREAALVAAAARPCVASRCLAETIGAPPWVQVVPDQPSPPLLAAALDAALDAAALDGARWLAEHEPAAVAARVLAVL